MTRTTGATDAQIEAAVERRRRLSLGYSDMSLMKSNMREIWAPSLVTTDHRIVRVDDLKRLTDFFEYNIQNADYKDHESYDRIIELIGEAE